MWAPADINSLHTVAAFYGSRGRALAAIKLIPGAEAAMAWWLPPRKG
jgi:hypothetical protein